MKLDVKIVLIFICCIFFIANFSFLNKIQRISSSDKNMINGNKESNQDDAKKRKVDITINNNLQNGNQKEENLQKKEDEKKKELELMKEREKEKERELEKERERQLEIERQKQKQLQLEKEKERENERRKLEEEMQREKEEARKLELEKQKERKKREKMPPQKELEGMKKLGKKQVDEDEDLRALDVWTEYYGDPVEFLKNHLIEEAKKHQRNEWIFEASRSYPSTPFQLINQQNESTITSSKFVIPQPFLNEKERISSLLQHRPKLRGLWENCYLYTLEKTTLELNNGNIFVITGKIFFLFFIYFIYLFFLKR